MVYLIFLQVGLFAILALALIVTINDLKNLSDNCTKLFEAQRKAILESSKMISSLIVTINNLKGLSDNCTKLFEAQRGVILDNSKMVSSLYQELERTKQELEDFCARIQSQ